MSRARLSGKLMGEIAIQPSKSAAHRAVICASLAEGTSTIDNIAMSDDISATADCASALGLADMEFDEKGKRAVITGRSIKGCDRAVLDCAESGSTMRFFLPLAPLFSRKAVFTGRGRLMERPTEPLKSLLISKGTSWREEPRVLSGGYEGGVFEISGGISSQFITGLLFALPLLPKKSAILLTSPAESSGYIDMTVEMLRRFGIDAARGEKELTAFGRYAPADVTVEGDWSHAAFYAVAGALYGKTTLTGLDMHSVQGDRAVIDILARMGAKVNTVKDSVTVERGELMATDIDGSQIPDIVPVLAAAASVARGTTRIYNAGRLRIKECDRLAAMADDLAQVGADVSETEDGLIIRGRETLAGGDASSFSDHRIAMTMAVLAGMTRDGITIDDTECVKKSAPDFWREFGALGGRKA